MACTYILYSQSLNKYYVGATRDISSRLVEHLKYKHKTKFTRKIAADWQVRFTKEFPSFSEATTFEKFIKRQKSKKYIIDLINSSL